MEEINVSIPKSIENMQLPNPELLTYWCGKPTPLGVGWIAI